MEESGNIKRVQVSSGWLICCFGAIIMTLVVTVICLSLPKSAVTVENHTPATSSSTESGRTTSSTPRIFIPNFALSPSRGRTKRNTSEFHSFLKHRDSPPEGGGTRGIKKRPIPDLQTTRRSVQEKVTEPGTVAAITTSPMPTTTKEPITTTTPLADTTSTYPTTSNSKQQEQESEPEIPDNQGWVMRTTLLLSGILVALGAIGIMVGAVLLGSRRREERMIAMIGQISPPTSPSYMRANNIHHVSIPTFRRQIIDQPGTFEEASSLVSEFPEVSGPVPIRSTMEDAGTEDRESSTFNRKLDEHNKLWIHDRPGDAVMPQDFEDGRAPLVLLNENFQADDLKFATVSPSGTRRFKTFQPKDYLNSVEAFPTV